MALLEQLTLIELKEYSGRHRTNIPSSTSVIQNKRNEIVYEPFTIMASSIQPLNGKTLNALPEGYRAKAQYQFWTKTAILGIDQGTEQLPDQIEIDGYWYSIYNLRDWKRTSFLAHYHCVAIRDDANNSGYQDVEGGNYG